MSSFWEVYCDKLPMVIYDGIRGEEMGRLCRIGMNCGCEYTSLPLFRSLKERYTRFDHSIGTAIIVWRFTHSNAQTLAALFHDIATPCFAHVVDFMQGDHMMQESTEDRTREIIEKSEYLGIILRKYGLTVDEVADYHQYPVADNDSPKLCADRLDYTFGNQVNFGRGAREQVREMLDDLVVGKNESGEDELMFRSQEKARAFAFGALRMGKIYVSDEDRFAMQALAELLKEAVRQGVISMDDLWTDEPSVIRKLRTDPAIRERWAHFRGYSKIVRGREDGIVVRAKKRFVDPMVEDWGRMTALDPEFREAVGWFLDEPQEVKLAGVAEGFDLEAEEARVEMERKRLVKEFAEEFKRGKGAER